VDHSSAVLPYVLAVEANHPRSLVRLLDAYDAVLYSGVQSVEMCPRLDQSSGTWNPDV